MYLYPQDIFEKLEFDKILERLAAYCLGAPAAGLARSMQTFDNKKKIERLLDEVVEYKKSIEMMSELPLHRYESIIDDLRLLRTIDIVLDLEAYMRLHVMLNNALELKTFFASVEHRSEYPILKEIADKIELENDLVKKFEKIFDEEGKVKPTASDDLKKIYSSINSKERELESVFKSLAKKYKQDGLLTDNVESFKNSRRVLSVTAENKRKIRGIIHDESATGRTVFIEPEGVIDLNNDLFELEARKRHEIYKILKELGNYLRPYLDDFLLWQRIMVRYDLIRAKAKMSMTYEGLRPNISEGNQFNIKEAYHPLLYILNKEQQKKTIPFNLHLDADKRILVISGPNAGGKSVTLKSMGLNQLMVQSGMLVPVHSDSTFMIYTKMMIDIGDQQSLEGDLSTYSSRLIHMKHFMEKAHDRTLVLMDEFGSGSDPKMGGAIAEAVLDALVRKKCFGLITTHYSNIKNYAYKSKSIVNGAMLFDAEELSPTYKLKVGQPGSSFAFEIADKIGLSPKILDYAKKKAGKDSKTVDKLLVDLQHEKQVLEQQLLEAFDERHDLRKLIKSYETMKDSLEIKKKRIKLEKKEISHTNLSRYEVELRELIKDLKKERNLEKAAAAAKVMKQKKIESSKEIQSISDDVFKIEAEKVKDLKIGQFVKLRKGGEPGKVVAIGNKKVKLEIGLMQFEVPRNELVYSNQPIELKPKSINLDTLNINQSPDTELDIRGYSKMEALDAIQEFIDDALMSNAINNLKVLHGKGTGVLQRTLWSKAKEYKDIKKIWHPAEEFGGRGVTYISF